jgi:BMFP domain-containing protein YqiC
VSRVEVESTAMLASACGEADDLTWRIALLEGELAEAREARDTAEENSCLM